MVNKVLIWYSFRICMAQAQ